MPHKNVLIISPAFAPCTLVGAARMTSLAEHLIIEGYDVTVISLGKWMYEDDFWSREIPNGIRLIEIKKTRNIRMRLMQQVLQQFCFRKIDVCISSMGPFYSQSFLWLAGMISKVPFILDYRDPWFQDDSLRRNIHDYAVKFFEYLNVKLSKAVVCVTLENGISMQNRYKKNANKIRVIYNGFEIKGDYLDKGSHQSGYCLCCVGKFLYYNEKAAITLLKALEELRKKQIEVKLYHIGEISDDASNLLKEHFIDENVYCFLGKLKYNDAMKELAKMDAAVITYGLKSGLGTKVFDYIGMNKPIIYVGELPSELSRFVGQFKNTIIENDIERLIEKLCNFISNNISELGCETREMYNRSVQNNKYKELIDECMRR